MNDKEVRSGVRGFDLERVEGQKRCGCCLSRAMAAGWSRCAHMDGNNLIDHIAGTNKTHQRTKHCGTRQHEHSPNVVLDG